MKLKKLGLILLSCTFLLLTGCQRNENSIKIILDNGDSIKVTVKSTDNYSLKKEKGNFFVLKDNEVILSGGLIAGKSVTSLIDVVKQEGNPDILYFEEDTDPYKPYVYYETTGSDGKVQYNFLVPIMYSNTGAIISSSTSREAAQDAYEHLSIVSDLHQF